MARTIRIELAPKTILLVAGLALTLWLFIQIWQVLLLFVVSTVLAGALNPLVDWLHDHRIRRPFALGLILAALISIVVGIGALVIPALAAQIAALLAGLPELQVRIADFLSRFPYFGERAAAMIAAESPLTPTGSSTSPSMQQALPVAARVAEGVALSLTAVMLAFYLLADRERVIGFLYALLPRDDHVRTARVLLDMERVVGGYVRSQATTSGSIGLYVFSLLWLAGAPNALALALLAAFADAIPFIGPFIILIPAVLAALSVGPPQALVVLIALVLYQEFENRFLVPRVYGSALRLSPVAVLVAVLIGGKLLGVPGAILSLPIAAGIRVLLEDLRIDLPGEVPGERAERAIEHRAEQLYEREAADASPAEAAQVAAEIAAEVDARAAS